jgi:hypothetical protein
VVVYRPETILLEVDAVLHGKGDPKEVWKGGPDQRSGGSGAGISKASHGTTRACGRAAATDVMWH